MQTIPQFEPQGRVPAWRHWPFGEVRYLLGLYLLCLGCFSLLRFELWWRNADFGIDTPTQVLLQSFLVGLRFDIAVTAYLMLPMLLALVLLRARWRMLARWGFLLLFGGLLLLGVAEAEFYREFSVRFNNLVFEYLGHMGTVSGMIWDGYPVATYLVVWSVVLALFLVAERWLWRRCQPRMLQPEAATSLHLVRGMLATLLFVVLIFACRGGFSGEPLRWGDAFFSDSTFANHLALNGVFTLGRSGWDKIYHKGEFWTTRAPLDQARAQTFARLSLADETPLNNDKFPVLRQPSVLPAEQPRPKNVVVILMESFAGRYCGALGDDHGLTPEFDQLASQGVLFTRAFANGTHTHQGVYASLTSFPNLPGYEYLMKMMEANQEFSGLPSILHDQGFQSIFLYNGLFSWDNKEGFFRQHGIDRFVGTGDYVDPVFRDPVWGVSDFDVYQRANQEFRDLAAKGRFFGTILTLSNHSPFNLPEPLPFPRIVTGDHLEGRFNGMRYADWALGEFFRMASQEDYFKETLFVVTGDHGFAVPPMITPMALSRFNVPMLFYAPGRLEPAHNSTVASQVDIGPSVLDLLGIGAAHQAWGRNLFSAQLHDRGFAVVKASGSEEVVALIEDDYLLMRAPKGAPQLYRYTLEFPPFSSNDLASQEPERVKRMEKELLAYVQTGILALRNRHVGLPQH